MNKHFVITLDAKELDSKDNEAYKKYWTCKICKRDTSQVEYDYLAAHNLHLECALKEELKAIKDANEQRNNPDALGWEKKCPYCKAEL